MADVAARAGVSLATVSRALRGLPGVSAGTRDRVRAVAEELAYVVSPEASRLSGRRTGRVAVVVPNLEQWFYAAMLAGIERTLREADLDVLVYQVPDRSARSRFFQELPARRKVDAVVLVALPVLAEEEARLDLLGVDVVVAGGRLRDYPHVGVDDHEVALLAVRHLLDLGHRRIAMVRTRDTEGTRWSADVERVRGYRDALREAGIPFRDDYLASVPFGVSAGAVGIERLLRLDDPPSALFAYSDEIAVSALARLYAGDVPVPGAMSVVGVDGHPWGPVLGLSTVDQHVARQATEAGRLALRLVRGEPVEDRSVVVTPSLRIRSTTAPA